jgi:LuxR family transcriptional regulator, maltose regulon positive regulatory protein
MADLLRTKLALPRLRSALVRREALLARLDEGLNHKLTLLSAPAGFGKTTLVRQWLASRSEGRGLSSEADTTSLSPQFSALGPPAAWLSLDSGDDDPVRFMRYLIAACQSFREDLGTDALALLSARQQPRFEAVLTALLNDLAGWGMGTGTPAPIPQPSSPISHLPSPIPYTLVLEDYHSITARQVHELMAFLLDHQPATLHITMLTRSDPPLPLARLRAQDELSELRAADLRFSPAETAAFLQQALALPLSAEIVARLDARTEGWIAGLRLAALALQGRSATQDIEQVLASFAGSHRHVVEYLVADVLDAQPEVYQEFLLRTSLLSQLNAALCDAVTGRDDSATLLDQLERANLFVFQVGDGGRRSDHQSPPPIPHPPAYRYHALFAEAMQHEARRRLGVEALEAALEGASRWYEQRGLLAEAIDAALAARSFARVVALIEQLLEPGRFLGELYTLRRWVEALPEELLRDRPAICFAYATAILFTEDRSAPATLAMIEAPLQLAEERWRAEDNQHRLGETLAFRGLVAWWQGDLAQAFATSKRALILLPPDDIFWRGASLLNVGMEELLAGRLDAARPMIAEARERFEEAENFYGARAAMLVLADLFTREGQLRQADQLYLQVFAQAGDDLLDRGHALLCRAALAYQWNDLAAADPGIAEALDIARQHAASIGPRLVEEALVIPGSLVLARIQHARGQVAPAHALLQDLAGRAAQGNWPRLESEVLACQARFALAQGDLIAAQRWATDRAQLGDAPLVEQERDALIVARLLIAQGEVEPALRALEHWHGTARSQRRLGSEVEILALMALAQASRGDVPTAGQTLTQALALAQPAGFQRLFLDEGEPMAALLRVVLPDLSGEPLGAYVRTLLRAFGELKIESEELKNADQHSNSQFSILNSQLLIEPLSPQEQRVLRLLAAGLSNPEIADELVVSVNTIKTQVQSIYRKLNVTSRKEVRAAARRLNLH